MQSPFFALSALALLLTASASAQSAVPTPESLPLPLTNAAAIHNLTPVAAAQALPIHLRGVVLDESEPREHAVILGDQTASVYVSSVSNLFAPYHRKDLLGIEGVTSQGQFGPCVIATSVEKLGQATDLPLPRPVNFHQLASGSLDGQYVEVSGVVRQFIPVGPRDTAWKMVVSVDGNSTLVRLPLPQDPAIQLDAEVSIKGICLYQFNQRRQALTPLLQVPHGETVTILKEPPADPYNLPIRPAESLLQYSPEAQQRHRIHVRGVVTYNQPGRFVWIRDKSTGLRLQLDKPTGLQPGDVIDALGFVSLSFPGPVLENAVCQFRGQEPPPPPFALTNLSQAFNHQDELVSVQAQLTEVQPSLDGLILTLAHNQTSFKATLNLPPNSKHPPAWEVGSQVRLTGICIVDYDSLAANVGLWHPQTFHLLLRAPDDLTILQSPSWWTPNHIMLVLALIVGGLLVFSGTLLLLSRRRLAEQARRRSLAEAQFAAVINERNRLARDIHDTLAQGLVATSVQLQLVEINSRNNSERARQHLTNAQRLVHDSLEEARKTIWNMRPQVLETGDLVSALKNILQQLSEGTGTATHFTVQGRERRLPAMIENELLRLGQEAITNALNHAQARHLTVKMEFGDKRFSLSVTDDGCGFDPANPPRSQGGFGLVGMKERAKQLHGQLSIRSQPGQGSEIQLHVPLTGE